MTTEEIVAHQRRAKAFSETEIGRLFNAFDRTHAAAWQLDTESGYSGHYRSAEKAWEAEGVARNALLAKLHALAGLPED